MTATQTSIESYRDHFAAVASRSPQSLRRQALDRFCELGFPTTRDEDWRFTNVAPIADTEFRPAMPSELTDADLAGELFDGLPRLVFVNGHFAPTLSAPGPAHVSSLGSLLADGANPAATYLATCADWMQHPFTALNTAFMLDGAVVHVPRGVVLDTPIDVLFVSVPDADPRMTHPRNLIVAEEGSQVTVIERYVGLGAAPMRGFTNAVTEIIAGPNAVVDHYKVGRESEQTLHVGRTQILQAADSNVSSHTFTIGGRIVRNDVTTVLDGPGGQCTLNGLYLTHGEQHVDNHLRVEHAKPNCDSREYFKGILEDRARAVFTGRIVVHEDAQKTDAKQTNMNMLLSDDARIDTKPQLEILADDVKCTHGATIGQIDNEAIFYLRSRGLDEDTARAVLVYAFAAESIDQVRPECLRDRLRELLFDRLPHGELLRVAL